MNFTRLSEFPICSDLLLSMQTRSFQYVSDLVDGLVALMNGNHTGPINLGNPDEYTMLQFAQKIKAVGHCAHAVGVESTTCTTSPPYLFQLTKSESEIVHKPMPKDDPTRRRPNITRAKTQIGWQPVVTVDEGLAKAIK